MSEIKSSVTTKRNSHFFTQEFTLRIPIAPEMFEEARKTPEEFCAFMEATADRAVQEFFLQ